MLDYEVLKKLIKTDVDTGILYWYARDKEFFKRECDWLKWNNKYAHQEALVNINNGGYKQGEILSVPHKAHRVMWYLEYKEIPDIVDHIDGVRVNNSLINLRNVSLSENSKNKKIPSTNKSGVIGVHYSVKRMKWIAKIQMDGKTRTIGAFDCIDEAIKARKEVEIEYGFHENHGRV